MKKSNQLANVLLFTAICLFACVPLLAQVTNANTNGIIIPDPINPVTAPLPTDLISYWAFAWPIFTALLTAGLKKIAPKIPRKFIPIIPAVLGILLGVGMQLVAKHVTVPGTILYGLLGGAGVWLRENVDQIIVQPNQPPAEKVAELNAKIAEVNKDPRATT